MKPIPRYKNKYSITKDGKVWSNFSKRFLKPQLGSYGYWIITLPGLGKNSQKLKTYYIHRLIADAFIPKVKGKSKINHKNGKRDDNRLENLEWCTQKENIRHSWETGLCQPRYNENHPATKLTLLQIEDLKPKLNYKYGTLTKLAKEYGVSPSLISLIRKGNYRI